jgi:hypothetical protein
MGGSRNKDEIGYPFPSNNGANLWQTAEIPLAATSWAPHAHHIGAATPGVSPCLPEHSATTPTRSVPFGGQTTTDKRKTKLARFMLD